MDTDSLRLFVLAADKLNISAAGRQLGMAPAVASSRLAKLEGQVGADLLHRSTRKVSLSLEGSEFLPYAREILSQEDAALAALGHGSPTVSGILRFTASSTFAQQFVTPILPQFMELYPGIGFEMSLSDTPFNLIEGSFDLALRNAPLADSSLKGRILANDRRILCAAPGYLERQGTPVSPEDLAEHQIVGFKNQPVRQLTAPDGLNGQFAPQKSRRRIIMDDGMNLKIATLAGAGISLQSLWNIYREIEAGTLVHVLADYEVDDPSALWLLYPKSNVLTAKVRVFMDFLLEKIGKSPPWLQLTQP